MPNPKRRHSSQRRDKRRTHDGAAIPTLVECSNCGQMRVPHRVCNHCGYYRGQVVVVNKETTV